MVGFSLRNSLTRLYSTLFLTIVCFSLITSCSLPVLSINHQLAEEKHDKEFKNHDSTNIISSAAPTSHDFKIIDIRKNTFNHYEQYFVASLLGVLNKNGSNYYFIYDDGSMRWLETMDASFYHYQNLSQITNFTSLVKELYNKTDGIIIFDDLPESVNIATPLCGLYNSTLVHRNLYPSLLNITGFADLPIKMNLTQEYALNNFTEDSHPADIYRWAFDRWFSQLNQTALALFNAGNNMHLRSHLCSNSIFTFWQPVMIDIENVTRDDKKKTDTLNYILDRTPQDMIVYGYMFPHGANEHPVVALLSSKGKYLVPSDWIKNLEFFQKLPLPEPFEFKQNRTIEMPKLENKLYIAGIYSDGDNIQYVANFMFEQFWNSVARKTHPVPIAFELTPTLSWVAPYIMYHFYKTATIHDYFTTGVGGKGYVKGNYMTGEYYDVYHRTTIQLMEHTDMREMRTWSTRMEKFVERSRLLVPNHSVNAVIDGYGGNYKGNPWLYRDTVLTKMRSLAGDVVDDLEDIQKERAFVAGTPRFIVYHLLCWETPYAEWAKLVNATNEMDNVEVVRLDQLIHLIQQYTQTQRKVSFYIIFGIGTAIGVMIVVQTVKFYRGKKRKT